jgi:hypothetical protein
VKSEGRADAEDEAAQVPPAPAAEDRIPLKATGTYGKF